MDYVAKTDWVEGEKLYHTDMNRIEGGLSFALGRVSDSATLNADWSSGE